MAQERGRTNAPTPLAVRFDAVDVACIADHVMALTRERTVYSGVLAPTASWASVRFRPSTSNTGRRAS
jgi:hypothetical protein